MRVYHHLLSRAINS